MISADFDTVTQMSLKDMCALGLTFEKYCKFRFNKKVFIEARLLVPHEGPAFVVFNSSFEAVGVGAVGSGAFIRNLMVAHFCDEDAREGFNLPSAGSIVTYELKSHTLESFKIETKTLGEWIKNNG